MKYALSKNENLILQWSIICRLATFSLMLLSSRFVGSFDDSGQLAIVSDLKAVKSIVSTFVQWDTLHFLKVGQSGYSVEQHYAFMPGIPWTLRLGGSLPIWMLGETGFSTSYAILTMLVLVNITSVIIPLILYRSVQKQGINLEF